MKRALPALLVVLLSGCEQQEAVPLSKSVPMAVLQVVALVAPVVVGYRLLERAARRRRRRPEARPGRPALAGGAAAALIGLAILGTLAWWITAVPAVYAEETVGVFSWEDSVALLWVLLVPGAVLALLELRLAAACRAGRTWAARTAGIQAAAAALLVLASLGRAA